MTTGLSTIEWRVVYEITKNAPICRHDDRNGAFWSGSGVRRRVYKMPLGGYRWDPSSHESPLNWKWLAMILHPHRFNFPLRNQITEAYGMIYGYTPTADDLDSVLRINANRQSAHYERMKQ